MGSYVLLSRTEIFNEMVYIYMHSLHLTTFLHIKMRWQMYYNLRLVNKIQEWPFFIHLNRCKPYFVLNKSEPLVFINSAQITLPL